MKKTFWLVLIVIVAAGSFGLWWFTKPKASVEATGGGSARGQRGGPQTVEVEKVKVKPMPVAIDAVGTMAAEQSVEIRPQIAGILQQVAFKEGDRVGGGQLLFTVEARELEAGVRQMNAAIARDQSQQKLAEAQRARLAPLAEKSYITRAEYDQAVAAAQAAQASLAASRAQLDAARAQFSQSRIKAPVSGRTGRIGAKVGNLVSPNMAEPLVVINQTQPMLVSFTVPAKQLASLRGGQDIRQLEVGVAREGETQTSATGKVVFVDNAINQQTGTLLLKGRIDNADEQWWPGQFVAVRLVVRTDPAAIVVPEAAVQIGQQGNFVYVVEGGKAVMRGIVIDRQVGKEVVVAKGLQGGEQVITVGPQRLIPGAAVKINEKGAKKSDGSRRSSAGTGKS